MQATIYIGVPHVRDGLIVANVGEVTNEVGVTNLVAVANLNEAAIPLRETR